jgi:spore germination protein YaaH
MIEDGDVIAVGVSAGKDSLSLLYTLSALARFYPKKFKIIAITVDMKFDDLGGGRVPADYTPIKKLCDDLGVEYIVEESNIAKIVFDIRKEKSPCSLCAKLRRGALNDAAKKYGAKIQFDENSSAHYFYYTDEKGREHEVWYEDARSFKAKMDLIEEYGLPGGFIWELMRENPQGYVTINSSTNIL